MNWGWPPKQKCDPVPPPEPPSPKPSSISEDDDEAYWGMYVCPDDPARNTREKAKHYYETLLKQFPFLMDFTAEQLKSASTADLEAVAKITRA